MTGKIRKFIEGLKPPKVLFETTEETNLRSLKELKTKSKNKNTKKKYSKN